MTFYINILLPRHDRVADLKFFCWEEGVLVLGLQDVFLVALKDSKYQPFGRVPSQCFFQQWIWSMKKHATSYKRAMVLKPETGFIPTVAWTCVMFSCSFQVFRKNFSASHIASLNHSRSLTFCRFPMSTHVSLIKYVARQAKCPLKRFRRLKPGLGAGMSDRYQMRGYIP